MHSEKSSLVLIVMMFRSKVCQGVMVVCLRVDSLKDAVGCPFGKADRIYLHIERL